MKPPSQSVPVLLLSFLLLISLIGCDSGGGGDEVSTDSNDSNILVGIEQIGALTVTGSPSAVLVYEKENKVYISDAKNGTIEIFDGNTLAALSTITGCAGVVSNSEFIIDQTFGKIYAGCGKQATTGVMDGDAKLRVIDATTDTITKVIDINTFGAISLYKLAIDETRHKVYVSHHAFLNPELAVIDVATDEITLIDNTDGARAFGSVSVNEITNKIYVIRTHSGDMVEIDGDTLSVSSPFVFDFPQPVQSGINHQENKLYIKTIGGPEGRPTVCIQDRNQASPKCTNIAGNDWGGIVTNELTNKVYLGVEVGDRIGILDGNTNNLTEIPIESATGTSGYTNQSHNIIVNENTNHIFFVNEGFLLALDGETQQFRKIVYADVGLPGGGLLLSAIAINRVTDQIYVVNDGTRVNKIAVFQDR